MIYILRLFVDELAKATARDRVFCGVVTVVEVAVGVASGAVVAGA